MMMIIMMIRRKRRRKSKIITVSLMVTINQLILKGDLFDNYDYKKKN